MPWIAGDQPRSNYQGAIVKDGCGAGYDILSSTGDGAGRLLEVKTIRSAERTPFYLIRNELALSDERQADFSRVRVFQFTTALRLFNLVPLLSSHVITDAVSYKAHF